MRTLILVSLSLWLCAGCGNEKGTYQIDAAPDAQNKPDQAEGIDADAAPMKKAPDSDIGTLMDASPFIENDSSAADALIEPDATVEPLHLTAENNKIVIDLIKKEYCTVLEEYERMYICRFPKMIITVPVDNPQVKCKTKVKIISSGKCDTTGYLHRVTFRFENQDSQYNMPFNQDQYMKGGELYTLITKNFAPIKELIVEDSSQYNQSSLFGLDCHIQAEITFKIVEDR